MKLRLFFLQQIVDRVVNIGECLIHMLHRGIGLFLRVCRSQDIEGFPKILPGLQDIFFQHNLLHLVE